MKSFNSGMIGQALSACWSEFKKNGGAKGVEAEVTSGPAEFEGMPCTVVVSIKLIPITKSKAA